MEDDEILLFSTIEQKIAQEKGGGGWGSSSSSSILEVDDDETLSRVFSQLKPLCLSLLQLLRNDPYNHKQVSAAAATIFSQLSHLLHSTPSHALHPFLDYVMIPLLLLLDASVACRSEQKVVSQESSLPNAFSDSIAEGVLQCLEGLLNKCHLGSVNQMALLMKKLTHGALLSPSVASEEFREGIIRCFRALLLGLHPCSFENCSCNKVPALSAISESSNLQIPIFTPVKDKSHPEECLLAFIQSENSSAAVGHWLSLLLKAADSEATRGHRGSARLRIEAFMTFRVLVAKVGMADALAFFLPGVVSQLAKVLYVSKTMISGAAGSTEAINQATKGLAEFLMIVLEDKTNLSGLDMSVSDYTGLHGREDESSKSYLETLRRFPLNGPYDGEKLAEDSGHQAFDPKFGFREKGNTDFEKNPGSLYVNRTSDWIDKTSVQVDKILSASFPQLCVHPAKKVREGLLYAIMGLLSKCTYTMKKSRLMLLECMCILVCDDSQQVSATAQEFLEEFFMAGERHVEIAEMLNRLMEKLPKILLARDEKNALAHAQRLLAVMYYAGPEVVVDHLLLSPITSARFLDALALCLNQNSLFAGSLDKFLAKPVSVGFLHSVTELRSVSPSSYTEQTFVSSASSKLLDIHDKLSENPLESARQDYTVPSIPPWFMHVGSQKMYQTLADIVRLVGLSTVADSRNEVSLSVIVDIPLNYLRKLISEIRMKQYSTQSWHSWYIESGSGHLLRQASTAVCLLNEIIYGASGQCIERYIKMFQKSRRNKKDLQGCDAGCANAHPFKTENSLLCPWKVCADARGHLTDCVRSILHEYLSPELWDLPVSQGVSLIEVDNEAEDITLHLFRDSAILHQVIIDGIGTFNMSLGKDFTSSGFLHSSLYVLLENLICSSNQIRRATDAVLHVISASSGYSSVGHLVVANADYIIDSLCRQLRHMDPNHHVPDVLAAMLSYIGVANDILPLLEEPMRSVSLELEVLGRHRHPTLTVPFLKAVAEIAKASKHEACTLPTQVGEYGSHVRSKLCDVEAKPNNKSLRSPVFHARDNNSVDSEISGPSCSSVDMLQEHLEELMFKFNKLIRYRRTVGSIAQSCLAAATPLLASSKGSRCLVALDIIEDGTATLAKVEEAFRCEKETKQAIEKATKFCSFHDLQDSLDVADDETDENRLLPAMNKIWPYLVVCIKNKNSVATRRCLNVVSSVVQICGGDFFSRRFYNDGFHFWKLLSPALEQKPISTDKKMPLQLPYRTISASTEDCMAETSVMKVQAAVLNMIADLSRNKRSASALEAVLKKVSGLVVGIACSGAVSLREASINALSGLACIDPDLIWFLIADVFYSLKNKDFPSPPLMGLPEISDLLPSPSSPKDFLHTQHGGGSFGFGIDNSSVEFVFQKLQSGVFSSQMYI